MCWNEDMKLGKTRDRIHEKLVDAFSPTTLEIVDESQKHAGHAGARPGGETHFRVRVVSDAFLGQNRVTRHRSVYAVLEDEMKDGGVHALALETLTSTEAV